MKKFALVLAFVMLVTIIGTSVAFAGGSSLPPTEVAPKEGVFYLAKTIGEQYPGLSAKYLKKYDNRLFFPAGKNKSLYEINGLDGDTIVHVALPRKSFVVITRKRYAKGALVKLVLDEDSKVVSATVFTNKPAQKLFAPSPGPQG